MNFILDLGLFALLFFLLVFIHELGHFLMAKWMGIRVEKFSIGMGPQIFAFKKGDTEYRLAWLPLGGYVKMAGDDPTKEYTEEEKQVGFLTQKPGPKLLVVFGGPVFNLILPLFVFAFMLMIGIPTLESRVGSLESGFPASESGLEVGDAIVAVDGKPLNKWRDLETSVKNSKGTPLQLEVERVDLKTGEVLKLSKQLQPQLADSRTRFGEPTKDYKLGISPAYTVPQLFYTNAEAPLALAGVERFAYIKKVNGIEIFTYSQMERAINLVSGSILELEIQKEDASLSSVKVAIPTFDDKSVMERIGAVPTESVVGSVQEDSPAAKAGLQKNDYFISVDGKNIKQWDDILEAIRGSDGKPVEVIFGRDGQIMTSTIAPEKTTLEDPLLGKDNPLVSEAHYRIGVGPGFFTDTPRFMERSLNPADWVTYGFSKTWEFLSLTVEGLYKLVTGQLSLKILGSPIMIYKVAGNTFRLAGGGHEGWIAFLTNLGLLSITLGLINLLPIPVLDGGHAVFFLIEAIRGKPVSVRVMEVASQIGLVILLGIFALVLYNDFDRYGWFDPLLDIFRSQENSKS